MFPKPIRHLYYWISYRGKLGYFAVQIINHAFIFTVRALRIKAKQDRTCLVIVSHKYKFIYIGIPKTATRSFMDAFAVGGKDTYETEWYETPADFNRILKEYPDYFKFSFVRNPWARIVSCYNSKIEDAVLGKQARIMSFYQNLKTGMSFKDFVLWLESEEGSDLHADRHWLSQSVLLCDTSGELLCDFFGQYENLEKDLKTVCEKLSMPCPELGQKGHISEKRSYQSYYDEESREAVARRYAKDIKLFGYKF